MTFYFDFESRSPVPISEGLDRYARQAEAIILTYAYDDGCVGILTDKPSMRACLAAAIERGEPMIAHNAPFDYAIAYFGLQIEIPLALLRCTRAQAYAHGLPGSLDLLGAVLGVPFEDAKLSSTGKRLIPLFCIPRADGGYNDASTHPVEWHEFCEYAKRDTGSLREVHKRLPTHNYRGDALLWVELDQRVNWRGFRFDKPLAVAARNILELAKVRSGKEIAKATGDQVQAATQRARLLDYLNTKYGVELQNLRAATVRDMLEQDDLDKGLRFLLEARLEAAKSSGAKYGRGLSLVGPQDRLRHTHQVFGAGRTGRDSHKGFQPGNMARQTMKAGYICEIVVPAILNGSALDSPLLVGGPNTAAANALRSSIVAAPGNELVDADYSNIESRVLAWLAVESAALERYREGADLYKIWYSEKFGIPLEEVNYEQRQIAKVVALSMGFLGGVGAFVPMASTYNLDLDSLPDLVLPRAPANQVTNATRAWGKAFVAGEDFELEPNVFIACDILKQAYRESNSAIFRTGHAVGKAVEQAIETPGTLHEVAKCKIWSTGALLIIELPDGSRLNYFSPQLHHTVEVDPVTGERKERTHTSYMTARGKTWRRETAWAGLYWENIVQATANRLLRLAALRVHADTLTVPAIREYLARLPAHARTAIVLRVHDSLTLDIPKGSYPLERMIEQMNILPPWARGLPIATEGWVNTRYGKWK